MNRVCSRSFATRLLVAAVSICSLMALLLLISVRSQLASMSVGGAPAEEYMNNEPGERIPPVDMAAELSRVRTEGADYRFEWVRWTNVAGSELYDYGNLDPAFYPHLSSLDDLSDMSMPFTVATTQREAAMIGQLFCSHRMAAPASIVALPSAANETGFAPPAARADVWPVRHRRPELDHRQFGHENYTAPTLGTGPLAPDLASADAAVRLLPELADDLFRWDAREAAARLEGGSPDDRAHAQMLRAATARVKTSPKHFDETYLVHDPEGLGTHYDWRFFRGVESCAERVHTIEALARTWSQFAAQFGIEAWWAHGSALGWMWDGLAMPWDIDTDIQVPVQTLDRLAWEFNYTLVVQHESEGSRAYLLEVNPFYVQRNNGNGNNVIDARFIDITTGTYADITGLAYYNSNSKVACKSPHFYALSDLSPLRGTKFEGAAAYVPAKFPTVLKQEYTDAYKPFYSGWQFNAKSRLWSFLDVEHRGEDSDYPYAFYTPVELVPWNECNYHLYGTCNRAEIDEFEATRDYTAAHEQEMELYDQIAVGDVAGSRASVAARTLIELLNTTYAPMHRELP